MNLKLAERIVNAVLYEGYILYPYRASSAKNRHRFNFGVLSPESYAQAQGGVEAFSMQTECLLLAGPDATLEVNVRFLHLLAREVGQPLKPSAGIQALEASGVKAEDIKASDFQIVDSLAIGGRLLQTWQEAVERDITLPSLALANLAATPQRQTFTFPASQAVEALRDESGNIAGALIRKQKEIAGEVEASAAQIADRLYKIRVRVINRTPMADARQANRDAALLRSLVSAHTLLGTNGGEFVSLLDPPDSFREAVAACQNVGTWPVLVGENDEHDLMLSSPIILYDYPQVAPESPGDLFDGTEIDEILTLRIMTLTDEEKREMRETDERASQLLERTESLPPEYMAKLHGALRSVRPLKEDEQ